MHLIPREKLPQLSPDGKMILVSFIFWAPQEKIRVDQVQWPSAYTIDDQLKIHSHAIISENTYSLP